MQFLPHIDKTVLGESIVILKPISSRKKSGKIFPLKNKSHSCQHSWKNHCWLLCLKLEIRNCWAITHEPPASAADAFPSQATTFTFSTLTSSPTSLNSTLFSTKVQTLSQNLYVFKWPLNEILLLTLLERA